VRAIFRRRERRDREAIVRDEETAENMWVSGRSPKRTQLGWKSTPDNKETLRISERRSFLFYQASLMQHPIKSCRKSDKRLFLFDFPEAK